MRKILKAVSVFSLAFIVGVSIWFCYSVLSGYGWVAELWETSNGTFKVRVRHYSSPTLFKTYVFLSSPEGSDSWREVAAFEYDGMEGYVPMPSNRVRFVDGRTGYFFMHSLVAVTTDAGRTWSIWRPDRTVADVTINPDGTGAAKLCKDYPLETRACFIVPTSDYGHHWRAEK